MSSHLLLVTGSGRSGTSSVAGALKRLGLHVPQPEVPADEKNPRGYYEPAWVTEFHKRVLNPVPVRTIDTRPTAGAIAAEAGSAPEVEAELREWLGGQLDAPQILVKDPRAFWILPVWTRVAADLGARVSTLTMLRHPTEVVRSRDSAYLTEQTPTFRRQRETANVAAWVNAAFETERSTRSLERAFVRYADLLADWRTALHRAGEQAGLTYDADLTTDAPHEVDDFIDAKLNRSAITWDDIAVPPQLRDLAERTWQAMNTLVDAPGSPEAIEALGGLQEEYVELFDFSEAIAMDATTARVSEGRREVRRKKDARIAELEAELEQLRSRKSGLFRR
ncbi:sulfotransferase family protein [Nocardioides currus]|uniref:Sulfotransferase family protein n=1 Tax=Nocardioides currus TaxID=2133958 RepID=A0A2R7Z170_9ACTN|nr:sulfotransferase family protein [Nocardioides currus]PUA82373.1 sulfotransferase family protein [Nocardioides currus]